MAHAARVLAAADPQPQADQARERGHGAPVVVEDRHPPPAGRAAPPNRPQHPLAIRPAAAPPDVPCSPPHVLVGRATHSQLCRPKKKIGSRSAELGDRRPAAAETGWMAAAETRVPDTTKALAEWEACMDGAAAGHG